MRAAARLRSEMRRKAREGRVCANVECGQAIPVDRLRARYCSNECARGNPEMRAYQRAINKQRLYGVTVEQFDALLQRQGSCCAICGTDTPLGKGTFHIDHDHETGRVRGLLCHKCNLGLGKFNDDPEQLRAAARYLEEATAGVLLSTL